MQVAYCVADPQSHLESMNPVHKPLTRTSRAWHGANMNIAFSTLFTFCFAWVTVYIFLRFLHAVWTVTEHFNRVLSLELRSRPQGGSLSITLESAVKVMGWGSIAALPVGTVSFFAALFR
jgi:hypothetical protein